MPGIESEMVLEPKDGCLGGLMIFKGLPESALEGSGLHLQLSGINECVQKALGVGPVISGRLYRQGGQNLFEIEGRARERRIRGMKIEAVIRLEDLNFGVKADFVTFYAADHAPDGVSLMVHASL